jgi:hypothetical protein
MRDRLGDYLINGVHSLSYRGSKLATAEKMITYRSDTLQPAFNPL